MKHTIFVLIAMMILVVAPASVRAQATAELNGRVTDESGVLERRSGALETPLHCRPADV
jgi:hypothetical protein